MKRLLSNLIIGVEFNRFLYLWILSYLIVYYDDSYVLYVQGGDPSAMYTVGTWIYQGRNGLERDLIESFKWQKKAADAGHPLATFNIGKKSNFMF